MERAVSSLSDADLEAEISQIKERLRRDRVSYPLNWRYIGSADKGRLAECEAERSSRKRAARA